MTIGNNLTEEEKAAIEELKRRTINDITPKMRQDETLFYRFLKARDFNLQKSEDMLRKHIVWRKEFQVDTILTDYKPPEVLVKYLPVSLVGYDKEGSPIIYTDMAGDPKGIIGSAKKTDLIKYVIRIYEKAVESMKEQSVKHGKPVTSMVQIYNYANMTFTKATNRKSIEMVKLGIDIFQDNYPERLKVVFDINTSFYFSLFFPFIKVVLAPAVYNKIHFMEKKNGKMIFLRLLMQMYFRRFLVEIVLIQMEIRCATALSFMQKQCLKVTI
ncbi:SEC14-like protein 2 like protein [Argiope bruennichi]|uniref:SEC14-like protein 2 like protein n=1 Tax=Argiope bruennichi TaxID=94029 RepID=A0A8T0FW03_ARGBR|nr:SEC14-like protein 2 like protein [Argiope bruennichi]